ncbi:glycosyltransferase family 2 protein [Halomicronema hongdechloris]|uniref:glycosyltransferase family 2 protein n=1 Tax=Halomicronema hongdechloris TaxID=1209493 RepID=UPI001CED252E|nr:glycosyltransferase family 2 protein [Halomicronema hongdechloris]
MPQSLSTSQAPNHALSVAVLIPAHDEEACIETTIQTVQPQLGQKDQLVVVADNCTDKTAQMARDLGTVVIERVDTLKRGKGYAFEFGIGYLLDNPPDVVICIDADCHMSPGSIAGLVAQAHGTQRPAQAIYLMETPSAPNLKSAVSAFAFKVKNLVRPLGLYGLGQPCLLTGTGMAFPWKAIRSIDLATNSIVEDMKIGIDLAIAHHPPLLCPQAKVLGRLPSQQEVASQQRTRWEHGHLQVIASYLPVLLKAAFTQGRFDLLILAVELAIPPLTLLALMLVAPWGLAMGLAWVHHTIWALAVGSANILVFTVALTVAWLRYGQEDLNLWDMVKLPVYLLWKLPIYLRFLTSPEREWKRTSRGN